MIKLDLHLIIDQQALGPDHPVLGQLRREHAVKVAQEALQLVRKAVASQRSLEGFDFSHEGMLYEVTAKGRYEEVEQGEGERV